MRAIDLFCGCGGMSLGFQKAGFEMIAAYDNWKAAVETYNENFDHAAHLRDITDPELVNELRAMGADIIIGGPPCQDFSIAGKGNHNGERANLTATFSEIVCTIRPTYFVMENVYNIEKMAILEKAKRNFKEAGYGLTYKVFDASLMGVPQARKRFFMIGKLNADDNFILDVLDSQLSKKPMTVHEYLGDLLETEYYYMHPRSYARRAVFSVHEPSSTIRGVNRPIPQNYQPHPADKTADIKKVKSLSTIERSLIQTFPRSFKWNRSKTENEQLIGNAVPVSMANYIAKSILKFDETAD
ncbi:DNA cytosine methyltransferase [Chitinophaga sancti]|uniref:DNA cytosine methyltransferase n=1 Tax=Chitinophaga sancti TaxID=1004 RepID=UPI002A74B344|nr:DNA cytosine methyltransferase [Chitinophaga sancti]WPQ63416.1 DNA cytosine methyltransferase [Chitinophaga sancti]